MDRTDLESLFELHGITETQDKALLNRFVYLTMQFQVSYGLSEIKLRKFLMIVADFIEMVQLENIK
jgi:hypothetical protein